MRKTHKTEFEDLEIVDGNVRLIWEYIGEGYSGDYDPEDPADAPLLRFSLSFRESPEAPWEELPDASYCTGLGTGTPEPVLRGFAKNIIGCLPTQDGRPSGYRRLLQEWSWLGAR